jgi:hypothetical protein
MFQISMISSKSITSFAKFSLFIENNNIFFDEFTKDERHRHMIDHVSRVKM